MRDDVARIFHEAARSMSTPLLALILADLDKWRTWAREHSDYAAISFLSIAIHHASAEMARREVQPKGPTSMKTGRPEPYEWLDMADAPKDGTWVILYFSVGTCRVPYVARYREGFRDPNGVLNWEAAVPIPGDTPTGWLPVLWKD